MSNMKNTIFQGTIHHSGYVVPDLKEAVDFFTDILGFEVLFSPGPMKFNDDQLNRYFGVPAGSSVAGAAFLQYGGLQIELAQWTVEHQHPYQMNPSDVGAAHLAITVSDLDAAMTYFQAQPSVSVREISPLGFFYITAPWGMEIQIMQLMKQ
ncbi:MULTISPECIES: VOC family protein [Paenibacillus]|uniref:VOC family protein n=1 Tax=Paenibacillus TaxID=44249 RepID=UPI000AAA54D1|nr:VOC family protein [Paenibacillus polymyxa]